MNRKSSMSAGQQHMADDMSPAKADFEREIYAANPPGEYVSETPLTDANVRYYGVGGTGAIRPEFARKLELDRNRLLIALKSVREILNEAARDGEFTTAQAEQLHRVIRAAIARATA